MSKDKAIKHIFLVFSFDRQQTVLGFVLGKFCPRQAGLTSVPVTLAKCFFFFLLLGHESARYQGYLCKIRCTQPYNLDNSVWVKLTF